MFTNSQTLETFIFCLEDKSHEVNALCDCERLYFCYSSIWHFVLANHNLFIQVASKGSILAMSG